MTMLIDITGCTSDYGTLAERLKKSGEEMNLQVHVMHEDIFNSMHRI